jgi:hypothetical protein
MHGPTCIVWANLTPFSRGQFGGSTAEGAAVSRAEFIAGFVQARRLCCSETLSGSLWLSLAPCGSLCLYVCLSLWLPLALYGSLTALCLSVCLSLCCTCSLALALAPLLSLSRHRFLGVLTLARVAPRRRRWRQCRAKPARRHSATGCWCVGPPPTLHGRD